MNANRKKKFLKIGPIMSVLRLKRNDRGQASETSLRESVDIGIGWRHFHPKENYNLRLNWSNYSVVRLGVCDQSTLQLGGGV